MKFLVPLLVATASMAAASAVEGGGIEFARDVQPILSDNCYACHGPDEEERKGKLRLDTEEGALKALTKGDPETSELIIRILSDDPDELMPPPKKKDALTKAEIGILRQWIKEGAAWGKHWAFEAPLRPELPVNGEEKAIDAFVKAKHAQENLGFSNAAPEEKLLRRVALDLTGLPPTLAELDAFLKDGKEGAYDRAVNRLLDSPHYGERWARWWLDAGRYADSNGYEKDAERFVWPYRDWVIDAFNDDPQYDQFIIRQVGGDLLPNASIADRVATGFLRNSMVNEEGAINAEQFRIEGIFDRMDALGKSVLGLTTQCAQCHTHKYDPILHEEYFGMFAYLNNSHEATVPYFDKADSRRIAGLEEQHRALRAEAKKLVPGWSALLQAWARLEQDKIKAEPDWQVVTPKHLGDGGQKFYAQEDGSLISMGYSPSRSSEKFEIEVDMDEISSLQIELLMDPYLTYGGPGRSIEGTAAVSEFNFKAGPDADSLEKVAFEPALSDLDLPERLIDAVKYPDKKGEEGKRREGPAAFINDGDQQTAWATEAGVTGSNQPRLVVMNLKTPIKRKGKKPLLVQFEVACHHGGTNSNANEHRNLGRFRFSLSPDRYEGDQPLSPALRSILAKPSEQWTELERESLFDAWMKTLPELSGLNEKISELEAGYPEPTPQLVTQEIKGERRETRLYHRGEQTHPRQVVKPHVPAFLHDLPESDDPQSRLTFARWLVDSDSPIAARTFVNRTWGAFFGRGIVETVEDLGHQAAAPSHPELLDWLAVEFMESGWDIKHLHRLIVSSRTYQQDSTLTPELAREDPENRFLARGPRFRPDAEVVRDIQLAASGLLNRTVGGDSVRPPIPRFLFEPPVSYGAKAWEEDIAPESRYRRALYTFRFRTVPPPFLSAFDAPAGDISCVRRARSTTPLQALALLNEPLSIESANALAAQIKAAKGGLPDGVIAAFRSCTSREPDEDELKVLLTLFEKEKADGGDPWLAVARVLLNLDETITKS
ncbi:MAG: PSD1 and planctomycete cytochrome C domain-containing protein [Verrucomicrobiales bacterium]|nr:PSD1 and planctomycete cytochrome C domain-containing protein [Verrucomicrobiales bacterium]